MVPVSKSRYVAESSYGEVDTNGRRKDPQLKAVARKYWHAKLDLLTVSVLVMLQRQKIALILALKLRIELISPELASCSPAI